MTLHERSYALGPLADSKRLFQSAFSRYKTCDQDGFCRPDWEGLLRLRRGQGWRGGGERRRSLSRAFFLRNEQTPSYLKNVHTLTAVRLSYPGRTKATRHEHKRRAVQQRAGLSGEPILFPQVVRLSPLRLHTLAHALRLSKILDAIGVRLFWAAWA